MATIKILAVLQENEPNQFTGKDGTPVSIYSKGCRAEVDGQLKEFIEVKAFDKGVADTIIADSTHEASPREYKGQVSYTVSKPRAQGSWGGRSGGGGGGGFKKSGGQASFALSYSKDVAVAMAKATGEADYCRADAIIGMADQFLEWLNENKD